MAHRNLVVDQTVLVTKDKRDQLDIKPAIDKRMDNCIARYEGYFPWAVRYSYGTRWMPGIYDYGEYINGKAVTQEGIPMNKLYPMGRRRGGKKFALPIYRHRFVVGKIQLWEHEIEYRVIKQPVK